jgi:hypothetical protein
MNLTEADRNVLPIMHSLYLVNTPQNAGIKLAVISISS